MLGAVTKCWAAADKTKVLQPATSALSLEMPQQLFRAYAKRRRVQAVNSVA